MIIVHIALQGCLKSGTIDYGITADTGGHIRYLLDLVDALEKRPEIKRQIIVTRRFDDPHLGPSYDQKREALSSKTEIIRIDGTSADYLPKEELYRETSKLTEGLLEVLRGLEEPVIMHAHYADAGQIASLASADTGIPYIFTGHSLGRVKQEILAEAGEELSAEQDDLLSRRIVIEEAAIAAADLIITSSRDEAERQYGLYKAQPSRVRINPPGCDVAAFQTVHDTLFQGRVLKSINRFLANPNRPPLLALSRPVYKKNLQGLIEAYGQNPELQEAANLVIFAGVRDDIAELEEENEAVLRELLYLIDKYNLYGKVALPKEHRPKDVPYIYRYAHDMGGVFVNVALNEPFGLTFIEAAAAGVPVIATNQGGPNDILDVCENGLLVDPLDSQAIAKAALSVIGDKERWRQLSEAGRENVSFYQWDRHAKQYVADCQSLLATREAKPTIPAKPVREVLLVCDIDNTLTGDRATLKAFGEWLNEHPEVHFAIATGRSLQSAIDILKLNGAPVPEFMITSVGSEIYHVLDDNFFVSADEGWREHIEANWDPGAINALIRTMPGLLPQGPREQRSYKLSYFTANRNNELEMLRRRLVTQNLPAQVIYSHGQYVDILPVRASKGQAVHYMAKLLDLPIGQTIAAGDSGNDADMLEAARYGIVVGNRSEELAPLLQKSGIYAAKAPHAAGVIEGLEAVLKTLKSPVSDETGDTEAMSA